MSPSPRRAKARLFVAEKPSVARDLARVLGARERVPGAFCGDGVVVSWCIGHMAELAPPEAYDVKWRTWRREFLPMLPDAFVLRQAEANAAQWQALARWLRDARVGQVVNACDAGREGELIFRYVMQLAEVDKPVLRLWLNAMTDAAIAQALRTMRPQAAYDDLAAAARCRAEADWLVGLNATRAMTIVRRQAPGGGELCSLGRVQTPTLAMVAARDAAIEAFVAEPFYEVWAKLTAESADAGTEAATSVAGEPAAPTVAGEPTGAQAAHRPQQGASANPPAPFSAVTTCTAAEAFVPREAEATGQGAQPARDARVPALQADEARAPARGAAAAQPYGTPTRFARKAGAQAAAAQLAGAVAEVRAVEPKTERVLPPPLYDLTTLQREANVRYGLTAQQTLQAAQALYEKDKAITYPRTDSSVLPTSMRTHVVPLLGRLGRGPYGALVAPLLAGDGPKVPAALFDDAEVSDHHAIVPTGTAPAALAGDPAKQKIYDLVVRRFIATRMPPARHARTVMRLEAAGRCLTCRGRMTLDPGWQAVDAGRKPPQDLPPLPKLAPGARCTVVDANVREAATQPPPRLSEATLLAAMERAGRNLDDAALRGALKDAGLGTPATRAATLEVLKKRQYLRAEGRQLVCTPAGRALLEALPVEALKSAEMTGQWEAKLAEIARGKRRRADFMAEVRREVAQMVRAIAGDDVPPTPGKRQAPRTHVRTGPHPLGWQVPPAASCPQCQSPLRLHDALLACTKGRDCTFVIFAKVAGRTLQNDEVLGLLARRRVGPLDGFVSRKGRNFRASLQLGSDGRVELTFVDVPSVGTDLPASADAGAGAGARAVSPHGRRKGDAGADRSVRASHAR